MLTDIERDIVNRHNVRMYNKYKKQFLQDRYVLTCTCCGVAVYASDSVSDGGNNLMCMLCLSKLKGKH